MLMTLPTPVTDIFDRLHTLVKERRTEYADASMRVPMAHYRDPERFAVEMMQVFGTSPQVMTPSSAIANAGDFITRRLVDGREVIVSRGTDGLARVLVNSCRHRGARVAEGSGCAKRFNCRYHGWSYDSTGALAGQPGRPGFDDTNVTDLGLSELRSEESFGFVWYLPADAPTVAQHFGEFAEQFAHYDYGRWESNSALEVEVNANWKCLAEAFYETYHFPYVHANSMVGTGSVPNVVTFDAYGRHARLGVPAASMATIADDAPPGEHNLSVIYYVYPNLIISNTVLGCEVIEVRPTGPDSGVLRHIFMNKIDPGVISNFTKDDYLAAIRSVIRDEDAAAISSSGHGIQDAAHDFVLLGRNEPGCQHIHRQINAALEKVDQ